MAERVWQSRAAHVMVAGNQWAGITLLVVLCFPLPLLWSPFYEIIQFIFKVCFPPFFVSWGRISLCRLSCPRTHYVDKAALEFLVYHLPLLPKCWDLSVCYQAWLCLSSKHTSENSIPDSPGSMFIRCFSILSCSEVVKSSDHSGYVIVKKMCIILTCSLMISYP